MTSSSKKNSVWFQLINDPWLPVLGLGNAVLLFSLFQFFRLDQVFLISEGLKFKIMQVLYLSSLILILILGISFIGNLFYKQWKKGFVRLGSGFILFILSFAVFMGQTSGGRLAGDDVFNNKRDMAVTARVLKKYYKINGHYPDSLNEVDYMEYRLYPGEGIRKWDTWDNQFFYHPASNRQTYELRSLGLDKIYGTGDDIIGKSLNGK